MLIDLTGKRILVTGASRGIGLAIANALESSGATVARHATKLNDKAIEGAFLTADFSKPENAAILFDDAVKMLGGLDVLINNAGIAVESDPQAEDDLWIQEWDKTLAVNLTSAAVLCKKAVALFREQSGGTIINITSRAAFRGDTEEYLAYAASKGGLVALTRSIARACGKDNITAFNIAPGFVYTDMAKQFFDKYGSDFGTNDLSLNELTKPEDVSGMVVFLASGKAKHATGATIDMNAGSYVH